MSGTAPTGSGAGSPRSPTGTADSDFAVSTSSLTDVDLDVVRPYLDTLPFTGRVSGRLRADGYFDQMQIGVDWRFYDYRVDGQPTNLVQMHGPVTLGGPEGFIFHGVTVDSADLDFPTIRLAVPAAILEGRARGSGMLDGPWKDVTFTGHLVQHDPDRPASCMRRTDPDQHAGQHRRARRRSQFRAPRLRRRSAFLPHAHRRSAA